jgi:hypothetical protein
VTRAVLYVSIACDTVSDAQRHLRRFIDAGLNIDHPTVAVSIGDPTPTHDPELEARAVAAVENNTQRSTT